MQGKTNSNELMSALQTAAAALSTAGHEGTPQHVKLILKDNTLTIISSLPYVGTRSVLDADCEVPGEAIIPVNCPSEALKFVPEDEDVTIRTTDGRTDMISESCGMIMSFHDTSYDIPEPPVMPENALALPSWFRKAITQCFKGIPVNGSREMLKGLRLDHDGAMLTAVVTNGKMMIYVSAEAASPAMPPATLPQSAEKPFRALPESDSLSYATDGKWIWFRAGNTILSVLAKAEEFPAWQKIIPTGYTMSFRPEFPKFGKGIKLAMQATESKKTGNSKVLLRLSGDNGVVLSAKNDDGGSRAVAGTEIEGDDMEILIRGALVLKVLSIMDEKTIAFQYKDPNLPIIGEDGNGMRCLIMPMRA